MTEPSKQEPLSAEEKKALARKNLYVVVILASVALGFYIGFFLLLS